MSYSRSALRGRGFSFTSSTFFTGNAITNVTHQATPGYSSGRFHWRANYAFSAGGKNYGNGGGGLLRIVGDANSKSAAVFINNQTTGTYGGASSRQLDSVIGWGLHSSNDLILRDAFYDPSSGLITFEIQNASMGGVTHTLYWVGDLSP